MAWNDPPSFDYQQLANSGRKFKHRYVNSVGTKLGQNQQQPLFHHNPSSTPTTQQASLQYQAPQNLTSYPNNFPQHYSTIPQQQASLTPLDTNLGAPVNNFGAPNYNTYQSYPQQSFQQQSFIQQQQPLPSPPKNQFPAQVPRQ